jgi:predicted nicotinamide N-methyase
MSGDASRPAPRADRYRLTTETIVVAGQPIELLRPQAPDDLIDDEQFDSDDRLPYWAELWPSALVLAARIAAWRGRRRRFLELGCGLGLVSLAAARSGYDVLASDYYEEALEFTRLNAGRNGFGLVTRLIDWRRLPADLGTFDLVAASDVLYERRNVPLVVDAFARLLSHRGLGLVSDPGRPPAEAFVPACRARGLLIRPAGHVPIQRGDTSAKVKVFEIRKADAKA